MPLTSCPPGDVLRQVLLGRISRKELERIEAHLVACPTCAALLAGQSESDLLVEAMRLQPVTIQRLAPDREVIDYLIVETKSKTASKRGSNGV